MGIQGSTLASTHEEVVRDREHCLPADTLPKLTLTLPTSDFGSSTKFTNDVEVSHSYCELPRSSCDVPAGLGGVQERDCSPQRRSCRLDGNSFRKFDLYSSGTDFQDPAARSDFVDRNILELDRSCNHTPCVGRPASVVDRSYSAGSARHHSTNANTPFFGDPTTRRLSNGLSRLGQYVLRRVKLFSPSGIWRHRNNTGKESQNLKRVTRLLHP